MVVGTSFRLCKMWERTLDKGGLHHPWLASNTWPGVQIVLSHMLCKGAKGRAADRPAG